MRAARCGLSGYHRGEISFACGRDELRVEDTMTDTISGTDSFMHCAYIELPTLVVVADSVRLYTSLVINLPWFPPWKSLSHVLGMSSNLVSTTVSPCELVTLPSSTHFFRSETACPRSLGWSKMMKPASERSERVPELQGVPLTVSRLKMISPQLVMLLTFSLYAVRERGRSGMDGKRTGDGSASADVAVSLDEAQHRVEYLASDVVKVPVGIVGQRLGQLLLPVFRLAVSGGRIWSIALLTL